MRQSHLQSHSLVPWRTKNEKKKKKTASRFFLTLVLAYWSTAGENSKPSIDVVVTAQTGKQTLTIAKCFERRNIRRLFPTDSPTSEAIGTNAGEGRSGAELSSSLRQQEQLVPSLEGKTGEAAPCRARALRVS